MNLRLFVVVLAIGAPPSIFADELFVLDPATGSTISYGPCAFSTVDCEGLVFMTEWSDGYGHITVNGRD